MDVDGVAETIHVPVQTAIPQRALAVRTVEPHQHRVVHPIPVTQQVPPRPLLSHLSVEPQHRLQLSLSPRAVRAVRRLTHLARRLLSRHATRRIRDKQTLNTRHLRPPVLLAHRLLTVQVVYRVLPTPARQQPVPVPLPALLLLFISRPHPRQMTVAVIAVAQQLSLRIRHRQQPPLTVIRQMTSALIVGHVAVAVVAEPHLAHLLPVARHPLTRRQRPQRVAVRQAYQPVSIRRVTGEPRVVHLLSAVHQEPGAAQLHVVQRVVRYLLAHHRVPVRRARQPAFVRRLAAPDFQTPARIVAERLRQHRRAALAAGARRHPAVVVPRQAEGHRPRGRLHRSFTLPALLVVHVADRHRLLTRTPHALFQRTRRVVAVAFTQPTGADGRRATLQPAVLLLWAAVRPALKQQPLPRVAQRGDRLMPAVHPRRGLQVAAPVADVLTPRLLPGAGEGHAGGQLRGLRVVAEVCRHRAGAAHAHRLLRQPRLIAVGQAAPRRAGQGFYPRRRPLIRPRLGQGPRRGALRTVQLVERLADQRQRAHGGRAARRLHRPDSGAPAVLVVLLAAVRLHRQRLHQRRLAVRRPGGDNLRVVRQGDHRRTPEGVVGVAGLKALLVHRHLTIAVIAQRAPGQRRRAVGAQRRDRHRVARLVGHRAHPPAHHAAVGALDPALFGQRHRAAHRHADRAVRPGHPALLAPFVIRDAGGQRHVLLSLPVGLGSGHLTAQTIPGHRGHRAVAAGRVVDVLTVIAHHPAQPVVPGPADGLVLGAVPFGPRASRHAVHAVGVAAGGGERRIGRHHLFGQTPEGVIDVLHPHVAGRLTDAVRPRALRLAVRQQAVGDADGHPLRGRLRLPRRAAEAAGGGSQRRQPVRRHALVLPGRDPARALTGQRLGHLQRHAVAGQVGRRVHPPARGGFQQPRGQPVVQRGQRHLTFGEPVAVAALRGRHLHVAVAGFQRLCGVTRRQLRVTPGQREEAPHGHRAGEALRVLRAQQVAVFVQGIAVCGVPFLFGHGAAGIPAADKVAVAVPGALFGGLPDHAGGVTVVTLLGDNLRHLIPGDLAFEGEALVRVVRRLRAGHRGQGLFLSVVRGRQGEGAGHLLQGLQMEAVVGAQRVNAGVTRLAYLGHAVGIVALRPVEVIQPVVAPADAGGAETEEVAAVVLIAGDHPALAATGGDGVTGDAGQGGAAAAREGVALIAVGHGLGRAGGAGDGGDAAGAAQGLVGEGPRRIHVGHGHAAEQLAAALTAEVERPDGGGVGGGDAAFLRGGVQADMHHAAFARGVHQEAALAVGDAAQERSTVVLPPVEGDTAAFL